MNQDSIGAIWKRTSKKGKEYLSGTVELCGRKVEFIAFENDKGDNDKRPDYKIYPKEDNRQQDGPPF